MAHCQLEENSAVGTLSREAQHDDREAAQGPSIGAELEAILAISQVLTQLEDDQRQRVLRWAVERFSPPPVADSVTPAIAAPDLTLRIEDLDDLFGARTLDDPHATALSAYDELGDLFEETTMDDELGDLFKETTIATEPLVETVVAAPADQHNPPLQIAEAPLDALVADFVSEFRRLAVECQGS
jgi:hypothetical protein